MKYYSLSEIDVICTKAAKGAGYSYGEAEEAGRASRWLTSYNIPGARIALEIFKRDFNNGLECPIKLGNKINDSCYSFFDKAKNYQNVAYPVFLLPYISYMTYNLNQTMVLSWFNAGSSGECFVSFDGSCIDQNIIDVVSVEQISIVRSDKNIVLTAPELKNYPVDQKVWQGLEALATKILAPPTESSRDDAGE